MSPREGGPSPEEMGIKPKAEDFKLFEIKETPDNKFITNLPTGAMKLDDGTYGATGDVNKTFNSRAEAEKAVAEAKKIMEIDE